jgi:hypothetical protein
MCDRDDLPHIIRKLKCCPTLHCTAKNTEYLKQIFPEKELRSLPILLQENMWTDLGNIQIAPRHMNVEILFWEYINGISLQSALTHSTLT